MSKALHKFLVNGVCVGVLPVVNRGLNYGDGLFETVFVNHAGTPVCLPLHLKRLQSSCERLNIDCDHSRLAQEIDQLLVGVDTHSILKIIVTRGYSGRGYSPRHAAGERILSLSIMLKPPKTPPVNGVAVRLCNTRLSVNPLLAGMKHLNRLEQVMARSEWCDPAIAEGLMLDTQGRLIEGTQSNVFLLTAGGLKTPLLHRCGVAGITRAVVMQTLAPQIGMSVCEEDLTMDDLLAADAVFLTNSLMGICPVIKIGCHHKVIDPRVVVLQQALNALREPC